MSKRSGAAEGTKRRVLLDRNTQAHTQTKIGAIKIPTLRFIKGGIASKVLLDGKFNVTLFAVDKGEGLSTHSSNYPALVQVLSGSVEIIVANQKSTLGKGALMYLPAKIPHSLLARTKLVFLLTLAK